MTVPMIAATNTLRAVQEKNGIKAEFVFQDDKKRYTFLGIFGAGQFILFLILKFYFFGSFNSKNIKNDGNSINLN